MKQYLMCFDVINGSLEENTFEVENVELKVIEANTITDAIRKIGNTKFIMGLNEEHIIEYKKLLNGIEFDTLKSDERGFI